MELCFRGLSLTQVLWYQPYGCFERLGKGALFWEDAALQVHHLATESLCVEETEPFPLVGSGSSHHPQQEAWQVERQSDFFWIFSLTSPHCWAHLRSAQNLQRSLTQQLSEGQLHKDKQTRLGLCSAFYTL